MALGSAVFVFLVLVFVALPVVLILGLGYIAGGVSGRPAVRAPGSAATPPTSDLEKVEGGPSVELGRLQGGRRFRVELPAGLARHVSVVGDSGTGKTTTLVRIAHDAAVAGYGLFFVDAKGTGALRDAAEDIAREFGMPFRAVDPQDGGTFSYNPATGTPSAISNKLVGAFSFSASAEVFKQIAQRILPPLVEALREAGQPVNLRSVAEHMNEGAFGGLGRVGGRPGQELADMEIGKLQESALAGMEARLFSLLYGVYGPLFEAHDDRERLDVREALRGGVTYVSLSAMAASEDTELMARVLIQDLKQAAAERLREKRATGEAPPPALLVFDEFAALREAEQIEDLLLQAREAGVSAVLSSQLLPEGRDLRRTMLAAGLLVSHAVGASDAQEIARSLGMRRKMEYSRTSSEEREPGEETERRSSITSRGVDKFEVEPDEITRYGVGVAAVRVRYGDVRRVGKVKVEPVAFGPRGGR